MAACLLGSLCTPGPADAEAVLHSLTPVIACSEPIPSRRILNHRSATQGSHCFVVEPSQGWERIGSTNGLLLLRRAPPVAGEPPLFFRPADIITDPVRPRPAAGPPRHSGNALLFLLLSGGVLLMAMAGAARGVGRWWTSRRRRARALAIASTEIAAQRNRLQVRRLQLVSSDDYGTVRLEKWQQEKRYFCKTRLLPLLVSSRLDGQWSAIEAETHARIERAASEGSEPAARKPARSESDPRVFDPDMDPIHYEHHCAILLRRAGWDAHVTAASGDQGADVVARRGAASLVVQCKLYRGAVGNAAVQQVSAARLHHRARYAAVVSNARFTASAIQLARTNNVHLLHHGQLKDFQPS